MEYYIKSKTVNENNGNETHLLAELRTSHDHCSGKAHTWPFNCFAYVFLFIGDRDRKIATVSKAVEVISSTQIVFFMSKNSFASIGNINAVESEPADGRAVGCQT